MKNTCVKKTVCLILAVCFIALLGISVYAASKYTYGNLNGVSTSGYLHCSPDWTYSSNARTWASSPGSGNDSINVILSFDEYNSNYNASYDNPKGAAETQTYVAAAGLNPNEIHGTHIVVRGEYTWTGNTTILDEELGN